MHFTNGKELSSHTNLYQWFEGWTNHTGIYSTCLGQLKALYTNFAYEANPKPSGDFFAENRVDEPVQRKAEAGVAFSIELTESATYSVTIKYLVLFIGTLKLSELKVAPK